ncbi:MAG: hypothetical protein JWP35_3126 [Caulobacter sp.]|nr:hypothetical protein [Caulobacter sp.]
MMTRAHAVLVCLFLAGCATPGERFTLAAADLGQAQFRSEQRDIRDPAPVGVLYLPTEYADARCRWEAPDHRVARCRSRSRVSGGRWQSRTVRLALKDGVWEWCGEVACGLPPAQAPRGI